MEAQSGRLDVWLLATAVAAAALSFILAFAVESPWRDLALGMTTSFVFFITVDIIFHAAAFLREGRRRRFFGRELVMDRLWLNCPDFELHRDATQVLDGAGQKVYWQRPQLADAPLHSEPMSFRRAMAYLDIQGVMAVATMLSGRQRQAPALVSDYDIWKDPERSFVAAGLTSNHCTELYLAVDPTPLFRISSPHGVPTVTLSDPGQTAFEDSRDREFAIIVRYLPRRSTSPERRWFLIAGLEEAGTAAAGDFLARSWKQLATLTRPSDDFVAVLSLHRDQWQASRLEFVLARSGDGDVRTAFDSTTD